MKVNRPLIDDKISKKMNFQYAVGDFQHDNNIQVKCISDRILLYIRYGLYKLGVIFPDIKKEQHCFGYTEEPIIKKMEEKAMDIYRDHIRANMEYTTKHPNAVAAALVYLLSILYGINITQSEMGKIMNCNSQSIKKYYHQLRDEIKY